MAKLQIPGWFLQWQKDFAVYREEWQRTYGEPYPLDIEDLKRWTARADIPGKYLPAEKIASGKWTAADIMPFIEGYLLKLREAALRSQLPGQREPTKKGQGDKKKGQKRRPLNDAARACIAAFNRKKNRPSMRAHCNEYAEEKGDSAESLYRTIKDYPELWNAKKKGTK